jgi:hypothetical protein
LLVLLPVFAGVAGSDRLFRISALIVMISIILHGASPMLLARFGQTSEPKEPEPSPAPEPRPEPRALPVIESVAREPVGAQSITLEELELLQRSGEQTILLDVRTERSRDTSDFQAKGSVRMPPENVVIQAKELKLPKDAWLIAYCA